MTSEMSPLVWDLPLYWCLIEIFLITLTFLTLFRQLFSLFSGRFGLCGADVACKAVSAAFGAAAASAGVFMLVSSQQKGSHHKLLEHIYLAVIAYFHYDLYAMYEVYKVNKENEKVKVNGHDQNENSKTNGLVNQGQSSNHLLSFLKANPLLVAHHLAIGSVLTPWMTFHMDHDPGELMIACALVFEASTPFVSLRAILSMTGLRKSKLYILNGLVMVIVFFFCRIVVYPVFYWAYARQRSISFIAALGHTPPRCVGLMLVVLAPQIYWFRIMLMGAIKVWKNQEEPVKKVD